MSAKTAEEVALKLFPGCGGSSGEQCDYCDRQKDRREWFLKLITAARAEGERVGHAAGVAEERERVKQERALRPLAEWHEDYGTVLWWRAPVCEPPHVGSPLDDDWDDEHEFTHWMPIPNPEQPAINYAIASGEKP